MSLGRCLDDFQQRIDELRAERDTLAAQLARLSALHDDLRRGRDDLLELYDQAESDRDAACAAIRAFLVARDAGRSTHTEVGIFRDVVDKWGSR